MQPLAAGRCLLFASLVLSGWHSPFAQDFPRKPIHIVTGSPGGGGDFASRLIAQGITGPLGQAVIVENHGNFTGEYVMRAAADGYTLLLDGTSFWVGPLLQDAPYDVEKDFAPITLAVNLPNVLVVAPTLPAKTVKELIDLAKRRPGEINYSAGSIGGPAHLAGELFKAMAGVNMVAIPYKGGAPALSAVIGGEVQVNFATTTAAAPHIKSGRLRILAVTSAQPSVLVPGVPTVAAAGVPGYEAISTYGVFAPARTPPAIISVLNREMVKVLTTPEMKERLLSSGEEAVGSSPDELAAMVRADIIKWGNVIRNAGIRAN